LATRTASSALDTEMIERTGPKISSLAMVILGKTLSKMVGSMK